MDKLRELEQQYKGKDFPKFDVGDTIKVLTKIPEGDKVRLHPFEGLVISKKGTGLKTFFTVRKVSYGEGVERIFPLFSPALEKIEVIRKGKVKKAKLYYIRGKIGKRATKIEAAEE